MACPKSFSILVTGLLLVSGSGCGADDDRLPPPKPGDSSGVGGAGGEGGGPTTPPNICECAYSAIVDGECGQCLNTAAFNDCVTLGQACDADSSCDDIAGCPAKCNSLPADEKPACAASCVLDNKDKSGFALYADLIECVCAPCAEFCRPADPIACE